MSALTRRDYRVPFGEMLDWLEAPWPFARVPHPMRIEDFVSDGSYVIRAELPGLDPEEDIDVTVTGGLLTIKAERREGKADKHHSEFRYGSFSRSMTLPAGADTQHIEASYGHGILTVTVGLSTEDGDHAGRKIPVRQDHHIKPT
jgi:HSP20 family protein